MEKDKIKELLKLKHSELNTLRNQINELNLQLLECETGLKNGDLVIDRNGIKGVLCGGFNGYFWTWRKIKKDGTQSKKVTTLYGAPKKVEDICGQ